jgi:hypothetical protein
LHQIDRESLPFTRRGFFPAYRMGIGKNSDMVGIKDREGYMKA